MRCLLLFLALLVACPVRGQDAEADIPAVAPPHFSQLVGKYRITSSAAPTEIHVEEPVTLTVRIAGEGPQRYRPERKSLQIFPDGLDDDFYVEAVPDRD